MGTKATLGKRRFFFLLLFFSMTASSASWYTHYEKALKAVKKKQWKSVVHYIQSALEEKKVPKLNARTVGIRFTDYLPFYYLGMAHYHNGRFKIAHSSFKTSLGYGKIQKRTKLYNSLQNMLKKCSDILQPESENINLINKTIIAGDQFKNQGNFSAAKKEYTKAVNLINKTRKQLFRLDEVMGKLKEVIRLEKKKESIREARMMFLNNKYSEAESILRKVLLGDPENSAALDLLKQINRVREKEEHKSKSQRQKTESQPPIPPAAKVEKSLMEEGIRLYLEGKFKESRGKFAAVLQIKANHPLASQWLAKIDLAEAVQKLNTGIRIYFEGDLTSSENIFQKTVKILSIMDDSETKDLLVIAYQFLAIVLIEKHYLGDSPGKPLSQARQYIKKIFFLKPNFQLENKYFSPKVVTEFTKQNQTRRRKNHTVLIE